MGAYNCAALLAYENGWSWKNASAFQPLVKCKADQLTWEGGGLALGELFNMRLFNPKGHVYKAVQPIREYVELFNIL